MRRSANQIFTTFGAAFAKIGTALGEALAKIIPLIVPIVDAIAKVIDWLDDFGRLESIIWEIGVAFAGWKIISLIKNVKAFSGVLSGFQGSLGTFKLALSAVAGVMGFLIGDGILTLLGDEAKKIVAPIMLAVGALTALAMGILAVKGLLSGGIAIPIMLAAVGVGIAGLKTMLTPDLYAQGGYPDRGTLFYAGEAGSEIVFNGGGTTGVANIAEIEEAVYRGTIRAWNQQSRQDRAGNVYLDGKRVGIVTESATYSEGVRVGRLK